MRVKVEGLMPNPGLQTMCFSEIGTGSWVAGLGVWVRVSGPRSRSLESCDTGVLHASMRLPVLMMLHLAGAMRRGLFPRQSAGAWQFELARCSVWGSAQTCGKALKS